MPAAFGVKPRGIRAATNAPAPDKTDLTDAIGGAISAVVRPPKPDFKAANELAREQVQPNPNATSLSGAELRQQRQGRVASDTFASDPWRAVGATVESTPGMARSIMGGALRAIGEGPLAKIGGETGAIDPTGEFQGTVNTLGDMVARFGIDVADQGRAIEEEANKGIKRGLGGQVIDTAYRSALMAIPAAVVGIATRSPALVVSLMAGQDGALSYEEARQKGLDPTQAGGYAFLHALIEGGTEYIPMKELMRSDKNLLRHTLMFLAKEQPSEMAATTLQSGLDKLTINPNMTAREFANELMMTALSTPLSAGAQTGAMRGLQTMLGAPDEAPQPPAPPAPPGAPAATAPPQPDPISTAAADLRSVMADARPLEEIRAEQAQQAQAEEAAQQDAVRQEAGFPEIGVPMVAKTPAGPLSGAVESIQQGETGPLAVFRTADGDVYRFAAGEVQFDAPTGDGTRAAPVVARDAQDVAIAAKAADTEATPAQKLADNYRKAWFEFDDTTPMVGLGKIAIETPKGSDRTAADGAWTVPNMPAHYGHLSIAKGNDGDGADVFIGEKLDAPYVYVIDQIDPETGKYDETKSMIGFPSEGEAIGAYTRSFSDGKGPARIGAVTRMPLRQFVARARADNLKNAVAYRQNTINPKEIARERKPNPARSVADAVARRTEIDDTSLARMLDKAIEGGNADQVQALAEESIRRGHNFTVAEEKAIDTIVAALAKDQPAVTAAAEAAAKSPEPQDAALMGKLEEIANAEPENQAPAGPGRGEVQAAEAPATGATDGNAPETQPQPESGAGRVGADELRFDGRGISEIPDGELRQIAGKTRTPKVLKAISDELAKRHAASAPAAQEPAGDWYEKALNRPDRAESPEVTERIAGTNDDGDKAVLVIRRRKADGKTTAISMVTEGGTVQLGTGHASGQTADHLRTVDNVFTPAVAKRETQPAAATPSTDAEQARVDDYRRNKVGARAPHEMSLADWSKEWAADMEARTGEKVSPKAIGAGAHLDFIESALEEGKTVPDEAFKGHKAIDAKNWPLAAARMQPNAPAPAKPTALAPKGKHANMVIRQVRDRNGTMLGTVMEPYDGTIKGARKAAEAVTKRMYDEFPDAGNLASRMGATDEAGNPKYAISPNFAYINPVDSLDGRATFGDADAIQQVYGPKVAKDVTPAAPKKPAKKVTRKDPLVAIREHFTPGNIVFSSYWREHDRVLAFRETENGGWEVQVEKVAKKSKDGPWEAVKPPRWHATAPDAKDVVVERAKPAAPAEATAPQEPAAPPKQPSDRKEIGKNRDGATLYEDWRGVRTLVKPGETAGTTETVQMRPTRSGMQIVVMNSSQRPDEFKTVEELDGDGQQDELPPEMRAYEAKAAAKESPSAKSPDQLRAEADLMAGLADLADIFGKNAKLNMLPEQQQKIGPVLTRVFDAAFRLGYVKFKQAAKFVLDTIRTRIGADIADQITIDDLQGAYIGMAQNYKDKGADPGKVVVAVESLADLETAPESAQNAPQEPENVSGSPQGQSPEALGAMATEQGSGSPAGERPGSGATDGGDAGASGNQQPDGAGVQEPRSGRGGAETVHPADAGTGNGPRTGRKGGTGGKRSRVPKADAADGGKPGAGQLDFDAPAPVAANVPASNFRITDEVRLGEGGEAEKFRDNLAAIRALKKIESENRRATAEEQRILARYVGWGGLANAFAAEQGKGDFKEGWETRGKELADLLTNKELTAARRSTRNAHYTSEAIVTGMWDAVKRLGFKGGLTLESSMGSGNFLGLIPQDLTGDTKFIGVEYDSLTARIAALLYPQATVLHSGFQKVPLPDGEFDLNIGNPPFGNEGLRFQFKPAVNGMSIHNQFFLAGMDALKPGGVQAMVVSRFLLDAKDKTARTAMAKKAKLLGAIRLPQSAFEENARTVVVTDILFFQKLTEGEAAHMAAVFDAATGKKLKDRDKERERLQLAAQVPDWINTVEVTDPLGGPPMTVGSYFQDNPHMIVGTLERSGSMRFAGKDEDGNKIKDITVRLDKGADIGAELAKRVARLPSDVMTQSADAIEQSKERFKTMSEALVIALAGQEPGSMVIEDGNLVQVIEQETTGGDWEMRRREVNAASPWSPSLYLDSKGRWYRMEAKLDEQGNPVKVMKGDKATNLNVYVRKEYATEADIPDSMRLGVTRFERLKKMVALRDLLKKQLVLESEDAKSDVMEANRKALREAYDAFVASDGFVNNPANAALVAEMPDGALVLALETAYRPAISAAKAKQMGEKARDAEADAAPILRERVVLPYEPPGKAASPTDALQISLSEYGRVNPERIAKLLGVEEKDALEQLTGGEKPLVFKDPESDLYETRDAYLSGNVRRKLQAARDAGLDANIRALEAVQPEPWGAEHVTPIIGAAWVPADVYAAFAQHLTGAPASVSFSPITNSYQLTANQATEKARADWEVEGSNVRVGVAQILGRMLNSQAQRYTWTDNDGNSHHDVTASELAELKARALHTEFADWVFADGDRRQRLVDTFNDKFNTRANRQYDGQHLILPGKVPDAIIALRRHQKNAVWRGISQRFMLLDHVVGAGKTFTAIARVMERRRMGLSKKPMIVVPNHMVEQFAADTYRLYPGAKVLAAGKKDFEKSRRRRLFAKIATGDWDVVIVPHSSFGFIDIAPETEERFLMEELRIAQQAVADAEEQAAQDGHTGYRKPFNVKEAERLVTAIETRLDALKKRTRDRLVTFEQLGVDDMTVDEAHEFKNLFYSSRLSDVRGMNNKTGSQKSFDLYNKVRVLSETPTGTVTFMTGTPISNSAVEMYTMMRYLAAKELRELGLEHFDAWRAQFVDTGTRWEPTESGRLKEVNRLGRNWSNMRSLMDLYYSITDAVTIDDIKQWYAEDNDGKPFPIPQIKNGKRQEIVVKPTEAQSEMLQAVLEGFDQLPNIEDPIERGAERLRLMDRARKVSLDARAVDPESTSEEKGGKLERAADEIARIYKASDADRGTQIVFLDRSVPKSKGDDKILREYDKLIAERERALAANNEEAFAAAVEALDGYDANEMEALRAAQKGGWNAYDQLKKNLVARGVPAKEIRFIQEANNDEQKQAMFDAINAGEVRVIIGSTPRMGAGTNIQQRAVAMHHLDVTWKPSDIEQREGRIIRQGNKLLDKYGPEFAVEILAYVTERTVDAKLWAVNSEKMKAINGIRKYTGEFTMEFEDEDSVGMAEIAALASGDPLLLERVKLATEIDRLEMQLRAHNRKQFAIDDAIDRSQRIISETPKDIARRTKDAADLKTRVDTLDKAVAERAVTIEGKTYKTLFDATKAAREAVAAQQDGNENARYSITVDGKRLTSKGVIDAAIEEALGEERFEMTIGGTPRRTMTGAAREVAMLASTLAKSTNKGDSQTERIGEMYGHTLEMTVQHNGWGTFGLSLSLADESGRTILSRYSKNSPTNADGFSTASVRNVVETLNFSARASSVYDPSEDQRQIDRAKKDLPDLKAKVGAPFPKADELAAKRARLEEIVRILSGQGAAAVATNFEALYGKMEGADLLGPYASRTTRPGYAPPYTRPDAYRFQTDTDANGLPRFRSDAVSLANARVKDALGVPKGGRAIAFDIFDQQMPDAKGRPTLVGSVLVHMDAAGKFASFRNISIKKEFRDRGYYHGEGTVLGMLQHNGATAMEVYNIQSAARGDEDDALPFWKKIGTTILNYSTTQDVDIEGNISLARYLDAAKKRSTDYAKRQAGDARAAQGAGGRNGAATGATNAPGTTGARVRGRRPGLSIAEVQRVAQGLSSRVVRVVQSTADLPESAARFKSDEGGIRGVFIPATDEIYLIADNLHSPLEVAFVVMHEGLHRGLRAFFGADIAPILSQIANTNAKVRKATAEYMAKYDIGRMEAIEEVLADMALAGSAKDLTGWEKLVAFIRKWAAALGGKLGFQLRFSDDMVEMLVGAAARRGLQDEPTAFDDAVAARYSEAAPTFYSALAAEVAKINARALTPEAWWQNIESWNKKGVVKNEELQWSEVEGWLSLQSGKVTKEQFLGFLRENGVKVETTVLSDSTARKLPLGWSVHDNGDGTFSVLDQSGDEMSTGDTVDEAIGNAQDEDQFAETPGAPKFGNWQLPGGDEYREVLMTLPSSPEVVDVPAGRGPYEVRQSDGKWYIVDRYGEWGEAGYDTRAAAEAQIPAPQTARIERDPRAIFQSGHWDQPNVVAHFRADVVTGADGKRYLRPFEFQSDWGQQGKKSGFSTEVERRRADLAALDRSEINRRLNDILDRYDASSLEDVPAGKDKDEAIDLWKMGALLAQQQNLRGRVPAAPFVTKTEAWLSLAIKRAIRMAADEGLDGVVFANGEQMVDLFDLSKQISRVHFDDNRTTGVGAPKMEGPIGDGMLTAYDHNDVDVIRRQVSGPEDIENLVGKDVAKKLLEQPPTMARVVGIGVRRRELSGVDLKVGGEGMRAFYDKIVPNVANDVLRKLGGGKVGAIELRERDTYDPEDGPQPGFESTQPGFLITDALRERALGGMPLFSRLSDQLKGVNKDAGGDLFQGAPELEKPLTDAQARKAWNAMLDKVGVKGLAGLVYNWNEGELSEDGSRITNFAGRDRAQTMAGQGGSYRNSKAEFVRWLMSDAPFDAAKIEQDAEWRAEVNAARQASGLMPADDLPLASRNQTSTPAFKAWFGDSKVVDAKGRPLVVYHGTEDNFDAFDAKLLGMNTEHRTADAGFFSSADPEIAQSFAGETWDLTTWPRKIAYKKGANVMPLYLSIKNPVEISAEEFVNRFVRGGEDFRKFVRRKGRDGAVIRGNVEFSERLGAGEYAADTWVALKPGQLKSAIGNSGAFDPNEPSVLASRAPDDLLTAATTDLQPPRRGSFDNPFGGDAEFAGDLSLFKRIAVHPRTIAALDAEFAPVYAVAESQVERRDQLAADILRHAQPYFDLNGEQKARVNAVLELGRLQGMTFGHDGTVQVMNMAERDAALSQPDDVLLLSPAEVRGYKAARKAMDRALDLFAERMIAEYGYTGQVRSLEDVVRLSIDMELINPRESQRLARLAEILFEVEQAKRTGYVPFTRWGEVGISIKNEAGEQVAFERVEVDQWSNKARGMAEDLLPSLFNTRRLKSIPQVKERLEALKTRYPDGRVSVFRMDNPSAAGQVDLAAVDILASVSNIDPGQWDRVRTELEKAKQTTGFRKHFLGSKNVPGYSTDFERALADYILGISGYLSRHEHTPKWEQSIGAIDSAKSKLIEYATRYRDYVNKPHEELQGLRQAAFFYFLSGVPATAMVNLTQVPLITMPYLTQFASATRVNLELARGYASAMAMLTTGKGVEMFDPTKAPPDMMDAFENAWEQGFFVPLQTYEIMGLAQNRTPIARGLSKVTRTVVDVVSLMFSLAERLNRIATFIAAYRLAATEGFGENARRIMADNPLARQELANFTPEAFAEWAIDETHYRMGKVNRPEAMRGVGAAILQFKGFMLNTLELYHRIGTLHGAEGKQAEAMMLLLLLLASGMYGLPGADDIADLIEFLMKRWKGIDYDTKARARQAIAELTGSPKIAEAMLHGAPRLAGGPDLASRLSMGNVVPNTMKDVAGVPLSLTVGKAVQAAEYAGRGQGMLAAAELMPNFIKNPMTAYVWGREGIRAQGTGKVAIPAEKVSAGQQAMKAIGFTPAKVAETREMQYSINRLEHAADERRKSFYTRMAKAQGEVYRAQQAGDAAKLATAREAVEKVMREVMEWNAEASMENQVYFDAKTLRERVRGEIMGPDAQRRRKQARGSIERLKDAYGQD